MNDYTFMTEEEFIKEAEAIIKNRNLSREELYKEYNNLLTRFSKLFKLYQTIIKISDNLEYLLHETQVELKEKNLILSNNEMHLKKLVEQKTEKIESITLALVNALENANLENDNLTGLHIKRVSLYSSAIARSLHLDENFVNRIELYASLHDIGKVGIPDSILKKPESFNKEEFNIMKKHTTIGGRMLDNAEIDQMAKNIAMYHHEKWDGTGYPEGRKGDNIPLEARIVAVADVFDALTAHRHYKESMDIESVFETIDQMSGTNFDPRIVEAFLDESETITEIFQELEKQERNIRNNMTHSSDTTQ